MRGLGWLTLKQIVLLLSVFFFSHSTTMALDPNKSLSQYVHQSWGEDEGVGFVNEIIQSRDGYIWLATNDGATRFDGVRFTTFDRNNTPGIKNSYFWTVYEDREGVLWFGSSQGGITRLKDGKFTTYTTTDGLSANEVKSIVEDRRGNLWIGTWNGL